MPNSNRGSENLVYVFDFLKYSQMLRTDRRSHLGFLVVCDRIRYAPKKIILLLLHAWVYSKIYIYLFTYAFNSSIKYLWLLLCFLIRCFSLLILILITPTTNGHTKEQHYNPFFCYNLLPNPVLLTDVDSKAVPD